MIFSRLMYFWQPNRISMNKYLLALYFLLFSFVGFSQIEDPVSWSYKPNALGNNEFELLFEASIETGWHLYSQHLPSDDGPIATSFSFKKTDEYELIGNVVEPEPHMEYDPNFMMDLSYFEDKVIFKQKIKVLKEGAIIISGEQEFMVCDATKCLPPEYPEFSFNVTGKSEPKKEEKKVEISKVELPSSPEVNLVCGG